MMNLSSICKSIAAVFVAASASLAAATAPAVWDGSVAESFAEGSGTAADPYKISNGAELALFAQRVSIKGDTTLNAVLTNDIYLNENSEDYEKWGEEPPANKWSVGIGNNRRMFQGKFDGKGHSVYGLFIDTVGIALDSLGFQLGLFGSAGLLSTIQNVAVQNAFVSAEKKWNGLSKQSLQMGLITARTQGVVLNVMAKGKLHASSINDTTISKYAEVGCAIGYMYNKATAEKISANCAMDVIAQSNKTNGYIYHSVGGVIGKTSTNVFVNDVFSVSSIKNLSTAVEAGRYIGGIIGDQSAASDSLLNSYYDISPLGEGSAPENVIGHVVGFSKNTSSKTNSKMKGESFAALLGVGFTVDSDSDYPYPVVFAGAKAFDGGDGSETSPYLIGSAKALRAMSGLVNGMNAEFGGKSYKMTADVELNEDSETYKSWETTPPEFSWFQIGREYHRKDTVSVDCGGLTEGSCGKAWFSGAFDGAGHVVKGLYVNDTTNLSQGALFHYTFGAIIKNVGVEQSFASVKGRTAGIVGVAVRSTIDSCHNGAELRSISQDNGGLVGSMWNSKIRNSYNTGNLKVTKVKRTAHSNGGLVGESFANSEIINCWNSGNITAYSQAGTIGGLVDSTRIENVYNRGNLISSDSVGGGLFAVLRYSSSLKGCYSAGQISIAGNAAKKGGIIGLMQERTSPKVRNVVSDCYYDSQVIGSTNAPTKAIGTSLGTVTNASALPTASMTTGRFAVMLGSSYKQNDAVNNGYPTFLVAGESFGVLDLFEGGDGSENNPFLIATATQLRNMEYLVNKKNAEYGNKHYKLIADIALNENTSEYTTWGTKAPANTWTPMGADSTVSFNGVFDGGNHNITGMYTNAAFSGLFGVVGESGVVENVTVKESFAKSTASKGCVGSIAGYNKGLVSNVNSLGEVWGSMASAGTSSVYNTLACGGIAGRSGGLVKNAVNGGAVYCAIKGKYQQVRSGGVVGHSISGSVENASNDGSVSARTVGVGDNVKAQVGGIVGFAEIDGFIRNVQNRGEIYAYGKDSATAATIWNRAGGIVGQTEPTNGVISIYIENCINNGSVKVDVASSHTSSSEASAGGIAGKNYAGTTMIRRCYNAGNVSANAAKTNASSFAGGITGIDDAAGGWLIESCYASGKVSSVVKSTSDPKTAKAYAGGISANTVAVTSIKGSYFYGTVATTVSGSTVVNNKGGLVGNNLGSITGSYFDSEVAGITAVTGANTGTLTRAKSLTTAEMQTNEFAWLLNTLGGDSTNSAAFSRYNSYPIFADDDHAAIHRVSFDDGSVTNLYTSYGGFVPKDPENPTASAGKVFVGWTDSNGNLWQSRQNVFEDMTVNALFTLVTEPIYSITFIDGKEILVKATETTGKIAQFPTAKNIPMGYHFDGWYDNATNKAVEEDQVFTGTATLVAKFSANLYKITFLDYDESEISSSDVAYGEMPSAPKATREHTDEFTYTHVGWTPEIDVVTGEATYTAVYDSAAYVAPTSSSSSAKSSSSSAKSSTSSVIPSSSSSVIPSVVEGSSSSVKASSSSSAKSSSSSAKSSSSVKTSSSSSVKASSSSSAKSSSSVMSSSSSAKSSSSSVKSSSSASDKKSSSSKGGDKDEKGDAILVVAQVPQFSVSVAGRTLQIAGAEPDAKIAVLDLRGNVIYAGFANSTNFTVALPRSGSYLVRIGNQVQKVNVK